MTSPLMLTLGDALEYKCHYTAVQKLYHNKMCNTPRGMPHGTHLGPKWAAKWVPFGQPKWDLLPFVWQANMGSLWACPRVIQVGPTWASCQGMYL